MIVNNIKKLSFLYYFLLSVLCIIGFLLIFTSTASFGVGVSPDSTNYIKAAEQIINNETITVVTWPPLYPAMLALFSSLFRVKLLLAARILNATLFGLSIFTAGIIYRRHLKPYFIIPLLGIIIVILSRPLIPVFLMAWSEPPFILFTTLFLLFLDRYLQGNKLVNLFIAAVFVALSSLTRYAGISIILVGIFSIIFANKRNLKKLITVIPSFVTISSVPIAIWLIRNHILFGTFTGTRTPSTHSYAENFRAMSNTIYRWYFMGRLEHNHLLLAGIFLFFGFIVGIHYKELWNEIKLKLPLQYVHILFIIVYTIFLVATSTTSFQQLIDSRYMSPLFIPINLLLLSFITDLLKVMEKKYEIKYLRIILIIFLLFFIFLSLPKTKSTLARHYQEGSGYTAKRWLESETIRYFKHQMPECVTYSNGPDVISFLTGEIVDYVPSHRRGAEVISTLESMRGEWPVEDKACVVWFDNISREDLFKPEELDQIAELVEEKKMDDGKIFYFSRLSP